MSNLGRLDRSSALTKQNFLFDNLVLYTASGKDANSTVLKRVFFLLLYYVEEAIGLYPRAILQ